MSYGSEGLEPFEHHHWSVRSSVDGRHYDRYSVPGVAWPRPDPIRGCQLIRVVNGCKDICIAPLGHAASLPECCRLHLRVNPHKTEEELIAYWRKEEPDHLEGHVWAGLDLVALVEDHELAAWHRANPRAREYMGYDMDMTHDNRVEIAVPDSIFDRRSDRRWGSTRPRPARRRWLTLPDGHRGVPYGASKHPGWGDWMIDEDTPPA